MRQATDAAGAVVSAREWTPFGVAVGESPAGLGYTGEWFDADVGLEYLRARWYQPGTGRFTQRDPLVASSFYRYASNNPINRIDPTGYIDWPTCVIQGDYGTCTIWDGDTYYKIGREIMAAGVPASLGQIVADITALNPQNPDPNYIQIGSSLTLRTEWIMAVLHQDIQIPPPVPPSPPKPSPSPYLPIIICDQASYKRADLTQWLVDEMNANRKTWMAEMIQTNLDVWENPLLGGDNPLYGTTPYLMWFDLVKPHGLWDFKCNISRFVGDNIRLAGNWYIAETTGNIHYGYLGVAVGFDEGILHCGADFATDKVPCSGSDSPEDYEEIEVGFEIWRKSGGGDVTEDMLSTALAHHPGTHTGTPHRAKWESLRYPWPYPVGTFDDGSSGWLFHSR